MILSYGFLIFLFQNSYDNYHEVAKKNARESHYMSKSPSKYLKSIFPIFDMFPKNENLF